VRGRRLFIATFLVPPLLLYGIFVVSPYAQAFQIAATDWGGLTPEFEFVGLSNFRRLLGDGHFWNALRHNALLLVLLPVVTILLGLFFASMISVGGRHDRVGVHGVRGAGIYRIVYFFPQVLSVAIIGVLWKEMYAPNSGIINGALRAVGLDALAQPWLGDPRFAFWCVALVLLWSNVGFYVVLFSAGMQSIPRDIYEAALLDGANRATTLFRVTVPLLWDTIQVAWVYLAILAIDGFAVVQIITN
jgi:N-acetylglucosamine transport system permease protein